MKFLESVQVFFKCSCICQKVIYISFRTKRKYVKNKEKGKQRTIRNGKIYKKEKLKKKQKKKEKGNQKRQNEKKNQKKIGNWKEK